MDLLFVGFHSMTDEGWGGRAGWAETILRKEGANSTGTMSFVGVLRLRLAQKRAISAQDDNQIAKRGRFERKSEADDDVAGALVGGFVDQERDEAGAGSCGGCFGMGGLVGSEEPNAGDYALLRMAFGK